MTKESTTEILDDTISRVKEAKVELTGYARQRFGHPLFFSFFVSFVFYNWQPISVFFLTSLPIEKSLRYITTEFRTTAAWVFPAISAILYTIGFPYARNFIDRLLSSARKDFAESVHKEVMRIAEYRVRESEKEFEIQTTLSGTRQIKAVQAIADELESRVESLTDRLQIATGDLDRANETIMELKKQHGAEIAKNKRLGNPMNFLSIEKVYEMASILRGMPGVNPDMVETYALYLLMNEQERALTHQAQKYLSVSIITQIRSEILSMLQFFSFIVPDGIGGYETTSKYDFFKFFPLK